jgi:transcriptional regulator with XRE-family HTH domain
VLGPRFTKLDQSAISKALHVLPSTLNRLLSKNPPVGGSLHLVEVVASYLNMPKEQILDGVAKESPVPRLRDLPGYKDARLNADRRIKDERIGINDAALERAGDVRVTPTPGSVNANMLIGLASALSSVGHDSASKIRVGRIK